MKKSTSKARIEKGVPRSKSPNSGSTMASRRQSKSHRSHADALIKQANKGIPNVPKPSMMDLIRGVDDFGRNTALPPN